MKNRDLQYYTKCIKRAKSNIRTFTNNPNPKVSEIFHEAIENYELERDNKEPEFVEFKISGFNLKLDRYIYKIIKYGCKEIASEEREGDEFASLIYTQIAIAKMLYDIMEEVYLVLNKNKEPVFRFNFSEYKGTKVSVNLEKKEISIHSIMTYFLKEDNISEAIDKVKNEYGY